MLIKEVGIEAISRLYIRYNCEEKNWSKIEIPPLNSPGKIQELQNEINCMNDSRDFQDAESVRSGQSHVTSQPVFFPPHPDPGGIQSRSLGMPSRNNGPPSIWDTYGISGNVFANPTTSSSAPLPQESNPWISNVSEHTSPHVMSESQTPVQDQRCQSRPSARNSVIPSEGGFSKNCGADQQRLQISDPHFDKFPTPATFACWKIRFKTVACTCSQFPTEAMLWIEEVELVDSVDDLKSSCSVRGIHMPNFEVLDAKIASALNRIIHNTQFKRKVSLEEQKALGSILSLFPLLVQRSSAPLKNLSEDKAGRVAWQVLMRGAPFDHRCGRVAWQGLKKGGGFSCTALGRRPQNRAKGADPRTGSLKAQSHTALVSCFPLCPGCLCRGPSGLGSLVLLSGPGVFLFVLFLRATSQEPIRSDLVTFQLPAGGTSG